ncbi:hypothetical protein [Sphingomonas sp.]|uniref:hypothetical protein n=1 Tax=Sphingomonas sp. TaxID=28214 RepID=UPI003B0037A4
MTWDEAEAYALTLDGAERSISYGRPAVKANGRMVIGIGHEPGSFVLHVDPGTKAMLIETEPATYRETLHYAG